MSSPRLKKVRQKVARTFAQTPSGRAIPCWGRSTPSSDQIQWWMISPTAEFRRRWDLMIMTFIVYNAFLIPLVIAFELEGPVRLNMHGPTTCMLLRVLSSSPRISLAYSLAHDTLRVSRTCWTCLDPHVMFAHSAQSPNHHHSPLCTLHSLA